MKKKRLYLLRAVLGILILANMAVIFLFSEQTGKQSAQTSSAVTESIAQTVIKDFESKPSNEQQQIINKMHVPVRKLAHMVEFGTLGALIFLLLLTWHGTVLFRYACSLVLTGIYACVDEAHQSMTEHRGPKLADVGIDLAGALILCTLILIIALLVNRKRPAPPVVPSLTRYRVSGAPAPLRVAVVADLHDENPALVLEAMANEAPDLILIPGDLTDDRGLETDAPYDFLEKACAVAPTYYAPGNHELACYHKGNPWRHPRPIPLSEAARNRIAKTGAVLLDNTAATHGAFRICGLSSGLNGKENHPDPAAIDAFAEADGYRILLCHHPEYYHPYVQKTNIELTLCGHAHGGQWRLLGKGAYAPGQGILPKYTAGLHDGRCVISRGLGNHTPFPRIFNAPELVIVELDP